jgi:hypothetical protein
MKCERRYELLGVVLLGSLLQLSSVRADEGLLGASPATQDGSATPASSDVRDPDWFMVEAEAHYVAGRFPAALESAKRYLNAGGSRERGLRMLGAAHCAMSSEEGALATWRELEFDASREYLRYVCARHGVRLPSVSDSTQGNRDAKRDTAIAARRECKTGSCRDDEAHSRRHRRGRNETTKPRLETKQ